MSINFNLTEDQEKIVAMAKEFADQEIRPVETMLDKISDPDEVFEHPEFWRVMKLAYELGFHKIPFPEEMGGLGLDTLTNMLVFEELIRGGAGLGTSLLVANASAYMLMMGGMSVKPELIDMYIRPFCEDTKAEHIYAIAGVEPNHGSDIALGLDDPSIKLDTTAIEDGDHYIITGSKAAFVSNGGLANLYVANACFLPEHGMRGSGSVLIPADLPGVSKGKALDKLGYRVLNQAEVYFDEVRVPKDNLIMEPVPDMVRFQLESFLCHGNTAVAYSALGIMRAAYEEALAYAKERIQGGKPIIEHPNIALKLFDAKATIEASKALLLHAVWTNDTQFPSDITLAMSGRWFVCGQAVRVCSEMIQVMGAYGISKEYAVEKFYRDAKITPIEDGVLDSVALFASPKL